MSMNKYMHPRNIYRTPPNFKQLAIDDEDFRKVSKMKSDGTVHIDFADEESLRTLTKCLLKKDFNLNVTLPPNQLVPTLPLRLNYILWIEDIMNKFHFTNISGVDIGCGASCIYPLLAIKLNPNWHMFATEVVEDSIQFAQQNINQNCLDKQITILKRSENFAESLKQIEDINQIHFTMCNPPFFHDDDSSANEQNKNRTGKRKSANNAKTGIQSELSTSGGEVEFVKEIIQQSKQLRHRIKVFTSMIGQKISVNKIVNELKTNEIYNFCITEFCQGRTTRWGIAWTLDNNLLLRTVPTIGQWQTTTTIKLNLDHVNGNKNFFNEIHKIFESLVHSSNGNKIKEISENQFEFIALINSWSNQRRKRREQQRKDASQSKDDESPAEKRFKFDKIINEPNHLDVNDTDKNHQKSMPLLQMIVTVGHPTDGEILLNYLNGFGGTNGVHELSQYIQNQWAKISVNNLINSQITDR